MPVVTLPPDEGDLLRRLRDGNRPVFLHRVKELVDEAGWPLRAVGEPLSAGRSTVRAWKMSAPEKATLPIDLPALPRRASQKVARLRPDVPVEDRERLAELAVRARTVNRWTPQDSPDRRASEELNRLIAIYVARGVPVRTIANRIGVTYRAVVARLERRDEKAAV